MTPDIYIYICPRMTRTPKLWHMYVVTDGDFIEIAEPRTSETHVHYFSLIAALMSFLALDCLNDLKNFFQS